MQNTLIKTYQSTIIKTVGLGTLLNLLASNENLKADSTRIITVDGISKTIKQWFDDLNTEFEQLYLYA